MCHDASNQKCPDEANDSPCCLRQSIQAWRTGPQPAIVTHDVLASPALAQSLANALVAGARSHNAPLDGFLILIKSAANPRAAEIGREQIERFQPRRVAEAIKGERAAQRAAIALSLIAGFQLMRQMIGLRALVDAESDQLAGILTPVFELIIQAPISTSEQNDI